MNNCLADLSRLIPADYLKKGRGRIEKTEIIEMAIKHMRHLQSVIANTRLNETADSTSPSPPVTLTAPHDSTNTRQPINIEHYRLGYLECLSEAMHFLVEVQGYFAGDSLCVQMINHLHKHCDKLLKGDALNFPRKSNGEISSSNSSTSTTNGNYSNNSPPLGMSNSTGSHSDDNQIPQTYENSRQLESLDETFKSIQNDFRPDRRYSELCYTPDHPQKINSEPYYPRYLDHKQLENENRSDSDLEQNYAINPRNIEFRKEECVKNYVKNNYIPRNYSISSGFGSNTDGTLNYEDMVVKEENVDGPSQLREMLTSPKALAQTNNSTIRNLTDMKRNASPMSPTSGCETSSSHHHVNPSHPNVDHTHQSEVLNCKTQTLAIDVNEHISDPNQNPEFCGSDGFSPENHNSMYKFKNTIKQRFSKENDHKEKRSFDSHEAFEELPLKKQKIDDYNNFSPHYYDKDDKIKYPDPLTKERLHLLDRHENEKEKFRTDLRFNTSVEFEHKKRNRYMSESDMPLHGEIDPISSRLSFGHKSNDRSKRWEEHVKFNPKLKHLSPNPVVPIYNITPSLDKKPMGLLATAEYLNEPSPLMNNKFNKLSISSNESSIGIPIFALHSKGSFYIPLTLDHSALTPFLSVLGITKSQEVEEKTVLHPVTISVNFQAHIVNDMKSAVTPWKCTS